MSEIRKNKRGNALLGRQGRIFWYLYTVNNALFCSLLYLLSVFFIVASTFYHSAFICFHVAFMWLSFASMVLSFCFHSAFFCFHFASILLSFCFLLLSFQSKPGGRIGEGLVTSSGPPKGLVDPGHLDPGHQGKLFIRHTSWICKAARRVWIHQTLVLASTTWTQSDGSIIYGCFRLGHRLHSSD